MKLGIFGRGRLGSAVATAAAAELAWQVAREEPPAGTVDCVVEASAGAATPGRIDWALEHRTPIVVASTGWELADLEERIGERIGLLLAPNLSLTVALCVRLTTVLARFAALDPARDPYIQEHHHARKRDAPGGTARLLARTILEACPRKTTYLQPPADRALEPHELCVSAVRGGHTASSHTIAVDAPGEVLSLSHQSRDLSPYGAGALAASRWLVGRRGVFTMSDFADSVLEPLFSPIDRQVQS